MTQSYRPTRERLRSVYCITVDDLDNVAGRKVTEEEISRFAQAFPRSSVNDAIATVLDTVMENNCSQCGNPLDDGEGYDGLCGSCADVAEREGRWS